MPTEINLDATALDAPASPKVVDPNAVTEKQIKFARSLYREIRDLSDRYFQAAATAGDDNAPEAHLAYTETTLEAIGEHGVTAKAAGKRAFSEFIDSLISERDYWKPRLREIEARARAAAPASDEGVPEGRYAIDRDGVTKFYKVDRPETGKWQGFTFVKVQASDDLYPVRNRAEREAILAEIAKDVQGAATRYGVELGRCYACGKVLTDETSRTLGIGPICRGE